MDASVHERMLVTSSHERLHMELAKHTEGKDPPDLTEIGTVRTDHPRREWTVGCSIMQEYENLKKEKKHGRDIQ